MNEYTGMHAALGRRRRRRLVDRRIYHPAAAYGSGSTRDKTAGTKIIWRRRTARA
jgi:hypothetical protein